EELAGRVDGYLARLRAALGLGEGEGAERLRIEAVRRVEAEDGRAQKERDLRLRVERDLGRRRRLDGVRDKIAERERGWGARWRAGDRKAVDEGERRLGEIARELENCEAELGELRRRAGVDDDAALGAVAARAVRAARLDEAMAQAEAALRRLRGRMEHEA